MPYSVPRHTGLAAQERARASAMAGDGRRAARALERLGRGGDRHVNQDELGAIRRAFGPSRGQSGRNLAPNLTAPIAKVRNASAKGTMTG
jgi:hypothetical protein